MAAQQALIGLSLRPTDNQAIVRQPLAAAVLLVSLAHLALGFLALRQSPAEAPPTIMPPQPVSVRWIAPPAPPRPVVQPPQPQPKATPTPARVVTQPVVRPRPAVIAAAAPAAAAAETSMAPAPAPTAPPDGPVREAEPLIPPRADAAYLSNPPPAYPAAALRHHDEGKVLLRVLVSADGQPREVVVERGSGSDALDEAAAAAVRAWRFTPGRRGETAVEAWVLIPLSFTLRTR